MKVLKSLKLHSCSLIKIPTTHRRVIWELSLPYNLPCIVHTKKHFLQDFLSILNRILPKLQKLEINKKCFLDTASGWWIDYKMNAMIADVIVVQKLSERIPRCKRLSLIWKDAYPGEEKRLNPFSTDNTLLCDWGYEPARDINIHMVPSNHFFKIF